MASKLKFDTVKVGDPIPTITIDNVARPDFVRYAGASGDFVPLHYDQTFAEAAGMPTVFAQGMWTAGCLSRCLTDFAGAGQDFCMEQKSPGRHLGIFDQIFE